MSHTNDVKTEVIIPGNGKNQEIFLIVYKGSTATLRTHTVMKKCDSIE